MFYKKTCNLCPKLNDSDKKHSIEYLQQQEKYVIISSRTGRHGGGIQVLWPLKEIEVILDNPDYDREQVLRSQDLLQTFLFFTGQNQPNMCQKRHIVFSLPRR